MAGKIVADIIEAPAGRISLNVANVTVASINASGLYTSTGNLIISQANQIGTAAIVDGAVTNVKIADVDSSKLTGNVAAARITTALNASGSAPIYACRAWVNFDGFNGSGNTVRGSGNVSSVTRNGTGDYTVNFANAMPDVNYGWTVSGNRLSSFNFEIVGPATSAPTVSAFRFATGSGATRIDMDYASVQIFR
jgi:hypothetical protein